jgi:hypothetical protein
MNKVIDFARMIAGLLCGFQACTMFLTSLRYRELKNSGYRMPKFKAALIGRDVSFIMTCVYVGADVLTRMDKPLSWRLPLALASVTIGVPSLYFILTHAQQFCIDPDAKDE